MGSSLSAIRDREEEQEWIKKAEKAEAKLQELIKTPVIYADAVHNLQQLVRRMADHYVGVAGARILTEIIEEMNKIKP
jgi:type III secretory pathway component EscV